MSLALAPILGSAGLDPAQVLVIRHAYAREDETGIRPIHADSTHTEILTYTGAQSAKPGVFPRIPPRIWIVFIRESGGRARLWSVVENHGQISNNGVIRTFNLARTETMADLRNRLVIGWPAPRAWRIRGTTAARYPVMEIADAELLPFPGFDRLVLGYPQLQAVMREPRYASWRTALSAVIGIYLITDMSDGRQYVGKADGAESIRQRWNAYASSGHGGNKELRKLDSSTFQFSLLRVFDPGTPTREIDASEGHFKTALGTRKHGLNRN